MGLFDIAFIKSAINALFKKPTNSRTVENSNSQHPQSQCKKKECLSPHSLPAENDSHLYSISKNTKQCKVCLERGYDDDEGETYLREDAVNGEHYVCEHHLSILNSSDCSDSDEIIYPGDAAAEGLEYGFVDNDDGWIDDDERIDVL